MDGPMTKFEKWMITRIIKRIIIQGPTHKRNIIKLYGIMLHEASEQFTEDNNITTISFLKECNDEAVTKFLTLEEALLEISLAKNKYKHVKQEVDHAN